MATPNEVPEQENKTPQRIGVLVVHGVGEQRRFECLESVATNLFQALKHDAKRQAHIESAENKVIVRWRSPIQQPVEAHFREAYWADLDESQSGWRWLKLVGWVLAMPGVHRFSHSWSESGGCLGMRAPEKVSWRHIAWVRVQLFAVALLFLAMLLSVDVLYWLLRRLSFSATRLAQVRLLIYDYLGDVKLYQDWFERQDATAEVHGEKSRVAIRRRVVRALVEMARDVEAGHLDGYFIIAHSLGTVVAFNGLMEHEHVLANYLSSEDWVGLPAQLKAKVASAPRTVVAPARPPWLADDDAINRAVLFRGLRGVLTVGSPLNKFATLWPALVPVNDAPVFNNVAWINVADCQDIVAGDVTLLKTPGTDNCVGGLRVQQLTCADQWTLATAHTQYWKAGRDPRRLIHSLVTWFESGTFTKPPEGRFSPGFAYAIYCLSWVVLFVLPVVALAYLTWLMTEFSETANIVAGLFMTSAVDEGFKPLLDQLTKISTSTLWQRSRDAFFIGASIVLACSVIRHIWERWRFRPQRP